MSAKPYMVQQDRPNLVIVPTGSYYEPPPKKVKKDSAQNLPTPIKKLDNSVFMKKTLNLGGRSVNNDVLIDVSKVKKPPASWASNFLQSIGGSSPKFARLYSSAPKLSLSRKENTQLNSSEEFTVPDTINNQLNTNNTVENQPMMDKEKSLPKINLNLIKHKESKPAPQSVPPKISQSLKPAAYTKENSQPNTNTKTYQSKSDTTKIQTQVRKEPCLPKGYKIPIQSKNNKHVSNPQLDIEPTRPNTLKESDQVNNNAKSQAHTIQTKYHKPVSQDVISNRKSALFKNNESNNVKIHKTESNEEKSSVKSIRYVNEFKHAKEIDEFKAKKTMPQLSHRKDTNKQKYNEEIHQTKRNKETANSKSYIEHNQFKKNDKEVNQRKTKQIDLPRSYRDPCPPETHKEIASHKSNKERAPAKNIKKVSKENNKKEASYSTKLKTKKCSEISKTTKHSKSNKPKKHKNHDEPTQSNLPITVNESVKASSPKTVLSNKEDTITKLKNKTTEKYNIEDKKYIESNTMEKRVPKTKCDERSSKSISPIKSVVKKIKMDHIVHDNEERYHKESNFNSHDGKTVGPDFNHKSGKYKSEKYLRKDTNVDLRTKLKRKISKNNHQADQIWDRSNKKNKFSTIPNGKRFVPDENLIISFDAKDDIEDDTSSLVTEKMTPKKKLARKKTASGKKCKKIKLEINILFDHADTSDEDSVSEDEASAEIEENADLSFLDDFNVDEIVKSLNECKDSFKNYSGEEQLTVNDAKAKEIQASDRKTNYIKAVANNQSAFNNNNESKPETAYCNNILSVANKTNEHEEMELQPEVNQNRHLEVIGTKLEVAEDGTDKTENIQYLTVLHDVIVKKEKEIIEGNTELLLSDNSHSLERLTASSVLVVEKWSSDNIRDRVKTEVDISRETEISQIKNVQDIEVQIASNGTEDISHLDIEHTIHLDTSQDNIKYNPGHNIVLNEPTLTKFNNNVELLKKNNTNNDSRATSKTDTKDDSGITDKTGVILKDTSETTIIEPDVTVIDDSDDDNEILEREIKNNQSNKENCATVLECSMESKLYVESHKVIIMAATTSENSEPLLALDTDHNVDVEPADGTKNQLNKPYKNLNTDNVTLAEKLEHTSTETNIKTSAETDYINGKVSDDNKKERNNVIHSEIIKSEYDNKQKGKLSIAVKANEKMVIETSEELPEPPEMCHVESTNSIPKAVPPPAKLQNVKTKPECDNNENGNLSKADKANEKMVIKTAKEPPKSSEKSHVVPENGISKAGPPNAKPQNFNTKPQCDSKENSNLSNAAESNDMKSPEQIHVALETGTRKTVSTTKPQNMNTKVEVKMQDKESPANSEDIDQVNKTNDVNSKVEVKMQDKESPANSEIIDQVNKTNDVNSKVEVKMQDKESPANSEIIDQVNKTNDVNSKVEVKMQDKESPANSEIIDQVNKTNDVNSKVEIARNIANDLFLRKLETKLLSLMGQKYTITKLIRDGKFSKIYTCKDSLLRNFTVKVLKNESDSNCLGLEKRNMICNLQNGVPENNLNCIRLIRGFSLCGLWCFLMEYYPKTLAEALNENNRSFHIDEVQNLSRQLVSAVTILRNNNIIHSDIKPSHILINAANSRIKLCGFDQASYFDGGKMYPNTGTVNYRAPEIILGYPAGYGIDVWSTALVMYEMATNRKLFPGSFNNDILFKQLCTLGSVPMEMLMQSSYRYKHFKGTAFCKVIGAGKSVIVNNIRGNDILNNGLFQTYARDWAKRRDPAVISEDKSKLCEFSKLLHNMLVMFPKHRIAIEFVFANPFIYETFDSC